MRRLALSLAVYAVLLMLLSGVLSGNMFLAPVLLFFLCGTAIVFKEYKDSMAELKKEAQASLKNLENRKNGLEEEIKKEDGQIFRLRNREAMIVNLYEITKKMSEDLTFDDIFDALSVFLKENFIFKKSELIILKETEGYIKVDKVYRLPKEGILFG